MEGGGWGGRVADEEGDRGGESRYQSVVVTFLPFTFCLSVWCCYECRRRTREGPDSGPAELHPCLCFQLLSLPHFIWMACSYERVFSLLKRGLWLIWEQRGYKHLKGPNEGICSRVWPGHFVLVFKAGLRNWKLPLSVTAGCSGSEVFKASFRLWYSSSSCLSAVIQHIMN